jgi:DNA polymerase-3 subunit gamma/tau
MLTRVTRALAEQTPAEALSVVDDLVMRGHDLRNFCRDLLAHLRDLLVAKVAGESALLNSAAAERAALVKHADNFSESDLVRFFHSLTETENNLRTAAHPRYQLEVGLVKLIEMRRIVPVNNLIERLNALEESLRTGVAPAMSKTPPAAASSGGGQGGGGASSKSNTSPATSTPRSSAALKSEGADVAAYIQGAAEEPPFGGIGATAQTQPPSSVLAFTPRPGAQATPPQAATTQAATAAQPALNRTPAPSDRVGQSVPVSAAASPHKSTIESIKDGLEKRNRMFLVIALEGARKAAIEGEELCIEFPPEAKHLRDNLAKPESVKLLREIAREVTGRDLGVRITLKEKGEAANSEPLSKQEAERAEKQRLREIAEQNPLVQQALRTFRGEIIDVRRIEEQ